MLDVTKPCITPDTQARSEDGDADALAFGSRLLARGVLGGGVEQRGVNLAGYVMFEAVRDALVGESFGPAVGGGGCRSRFLVSSAQRQDSGQDRIGLAISAARRTKPTSRPLPHSRTGTGTGTGCI